MATDTVYIVPSSRQQALEEYVQKLPAMIGGSAADEHGIVKALHARVAYTLYGYIMTAFQEKGRGNADEAGDTWHPLSEGYLAYRRPVTGRQPPTAGRVSPGLVRGGPRNGQPKDGYMTRSELDRWWQDYRRALAISIHHYERARAQAVAAGAAYRAHEFNRAQAQSRSAGAAWNEYKRRGGQTKLGTFGQRQVGVDYQTLVDTGNLRRSLQPGMFFESAADATYTAKSSDQIYESTGGSVTIGSRDRTAAFHHNGRGTRQRRLWPAPDRWPAHWWADILGQVRAGVMHFVDFFGRRS